MYKFQLLKLTSHLLHRLISKMAPFHACLTLLYVASSLALSTYKAEWEAFKLQYNRKYTSAKEEEQRLLLFIENKENIDAHNVLYEKGLVSYSMGINDFSDRFPKEIETFKGYQRGEVNQQSMFVKQMKYDSNVVLADSMDWRDKGAVTPVKDQKKNICASSYAFSATGALEALQFIQNKKLVSLSEQNIMDCTWNYGNAGCNKGNMFFSFSYVVDNDGIDTEESYPYLAKDDITCHYNSTNRGGTCKSFYVLETGGEPGLKYIISEFAPASAAIVATDKFVKYNGGIFYDDSCNGELNHAVLVVGYGTQNGSDFWIVKNSWGENWGWNGYILMSRNRNNNCGIASDVSFPSYDEFTSCEV